MSTPEFTKHTVVYKIVDDLPLNIDIYLPGAFPVPENGRPVVFFMHGGGFVFGSRETIDGVKIGEIIKRNWVLMSVDYRLVPEVNIDELWTDCEDAWKWLHQKASETVGPLDLDNVAVFGASAGATLALLSGYKFSPKPKAIIDYSGSGNLASPFFREPQMTFSEPISDSVGRELYSKRPLSGCSFTAENLLTHPRFRLYEYLRQKGIWVESILGFDPKDDSKREDLASWTALENISSIYPPTYILHGSDDSTVPSSEAKELSEAFKNAGVSYELLLAEGKDHLFYLTLMPGDPEYEALVEPSYRFLDRHFVNR
ncbi:uncharacterized protein VTP21DRAFT_2978 [Calcarisporiella thermophila]|uniref:uncharacterized protein n=1 Tax=Calcarisporiella thermophila TaxID=911321 RepID=UPI003742911B